MTNILLLGKESLNTNQKTAILMQPFNLFHRLREMMSHCLKVYFLITANINWANF